MTLDPPFRIGILEDDDDFRSYLADVIENDPDLTVVMSAETLSAAKTSTAEIDLCLVDLQLPDGSGVDYLMYLREKGSATKSLILTILGDRASVLIGFESGANGYLLKDTAPNSITHDIKAVLKGGNPISPQAATHLLSLLRPAHVGVGDGDIGSVRPEKNTLTSREREVLINFSRGKSYEETAREIGISPHTVRDYVKSIYRKLSVHSRNEAIYVAVKKGWLDL